MDLRRSDRLFYNGMSLAIAATVFVGFAPTYYLRSHFRTGPLAPLLQLHGLVFSAWILLFLTQTGLVAARRVDLHRRLGFAGAALAAVMVALGLGTAVWSGRRDLAAGHAAAIPFLATPVGDIFVFAALLTAGIVYRTRPETHKRLLLLSTIALLPPSLARWPLHIVTASSGSIYVFNDLFVAACVIYDLKTRGRLQPSYLWGGLFLLASQPLRLALAQTGAWHSFAVALIG
jgi:hypothetical protein